MKAGPILQSLKGVLNEMNNLSILKFLDLIDTQGEIDRKQAILDISLIGLFSIFKQALLFLDKDEKQKVEILLSDSENFQFRQVYSIFESNGKTDKLQELAIKVSDEIKKDYFKTQLRAMSPTKKKILLDKYPELRQVEE